MSYQHNTTKEHIMTPERIWTLSNIISILRGSMGFPIAVLLSRNIMLWANVLIFLAIVSDGVDGFIARKNNQVTNLGKALDPIADKVCIFTVVLFLIINEQIPIQFLIVVGIRDLLISMMYVYLVNLKGYAIGANFLGKISIITVTAVILAYVYKVEQLQFPLLLISYTMLTLSFLQYTLLFLKNFGRRSTQK